MIPILNTVLSIGKDWLQGRKEDKAFKREQKMRVIEAKTSKDIRLLDADVESAKGMQYTWKDEYLCILLSIPLVIAFIPGGAKYVENGFNAIEIAPQWYQACFIGVVISTFGLRFMVKRFFK